MSSGDSTPLSVWSWGTDGKDPRGPCKDFFSGGGEVLIGQQYRLSRVRFLGQFTPSSLGQPSPVPRRSTVSYLSKGGIRVSPFVNFPLRRWRLSDVNVFPSSVSTTVFPYHHSQISYVRDLDSFFVNSPYRHIPKTFVFTFSVPARSLGPKTPNRHYPLYLDKLEFGSTFYYSHSFKDLCVSLHFRLCETFWSHFLPGNPQFTGTSVLLLTFVPLWYLLRGKWWVIENGSGTCNSPRLVTTGWPRSIDLSHEVIFPPDGVSTSLTPVSRLWLIDLNCPWPRPWLEP